MAFLFADKTRMWETPTGTPASSYYLHFCTVGTTTYADTYPTEADAEAATNANPNPIVLNSAGRPANSGTAIDIWITGRRRMIFSTSATIGSGTQIDVPIIEDAVSASDFQEDSPVWFGVAGGSATVLTLTGTPPITEYADGMIIGWRWAADTTGVTTVNADGLGAKSLVKRDGAEIAAGDGQQNDTATARYNSTQNRFELISPDGAAFKDSNQSFTKGQAVARSALTDAATIAIDASLSNVYTVTLGGNRTLGQPTNPKDGQSITIFITQDGTGSRTLAYHADWLFPGGVDPTLTTTAAAVDVLSGIYNGATTKWYAVLNKAFA